MIATPTENSNSDTEEFLKNLNKFSEDQTKSDNTKRARNFIRFGKRAETDESPADYEEYYDDIEKMKRSYGYGPRRRISNFLSIRLGTNFYCVRIHLHL